MPETLEKLRPDRDLQCFFFRPSSIAAISEASPNRFTVSGSWRQQFDWCVIEWNRNNVYEHPSFRYLPDGDLSGLKLTYEETRENCIPIESDLYPTVNWNTLRIWTRDEAVPSSSFVAAEQFREVRLYPDLAEPIEGSFVPASAEFTLAGTTTAGDHIGLGCLGEGWNYEIGATDTITDAIDRLAEIIDGNSNYLRAVRTGSSTLKVTHREEASGANGNRVGAYVYVAGAKTELWSESYRLLSGGVSPSKWRVTIDFSSLVDLSGNPIPANAIRKMRWTYAAAMQADTFIRGEFKVKVSNWLVTGTGRGYKVASHLSRRLEDTDTIGLSYAPSPIAWTRELGNYSGGTLRYTSTFGASVAASYSAVQPHTLYLGTRYLGLDELHRGADIVVAIDALPPRTFHLRIDGEDQLVRLPLAELGAGTHQVTVTHNSSGQGYYFYFDFFEICVPTENLPTFPIDQKVTLATDWDTDHSIAIAAERTAWFVHSLGYHGRANHYVGALWFYEMHRPGQIYSTGSLEVVGTPPFGATTTIEIASTVLSHVNLIGDTAESIAKAFEQVLNHGSTAVRASAAGGILTLYARQMGTGGNAITISGTPGTGAYRVERSGPTLSGGVDGEWRTDLITVPRINRAARDWSKAYYAALANYGLEVTAAFSTELQHGDPSVEAGIAQRYPNGAPVLVNTPALQTNFSPASLVYWRQVHLEMAQIMVEAGVAPYLQFGEVQWWYFPLKDVGMTFYDAHTTSTFQTAYGRPMHLVLSNDEDPVLHPEEAEFLPTLIGDFTTAAAAFVSASVPSCKYEVLYPLDVNDFAFTRVINYAPAWTSAALDNLKTESFGFTFSRNLDNAARTIGHGAIAGFARNERSFLVGVGDSFSSWQKEVEMAKAQNLESIVLWALDQYCLIGYTTPLAGGQRRSVELGD